MDATSKTITKYYKLAINLGSKYGQGKMQHHKEELISAALIRLCKVAHNAPGSEQEERKYIIYNIVSAIRDEIRKRWKQVNHEQSTWQVDENGCEIEIEFMDTNNVDARDAIEYDELVDRLALTPIEQSVLTMRTQGYTLDVIAAAHSTSKDQVRYCIKRLRPRVRQLLGDLRR